MHYHSTIEAGKEWELPQGHNTLFNLRHVSIASTTPSQGKGAAEAVLEVRTRGKAESVALCTVGGHSRASATMDVRFSFSDKAIFANTGTLPLTLLGQFEPLYFSQFAPCLQECKDAECCREMCEGKSSKKRQMANCGAPLACTKTPCASDAAPSTPPPCQSKPSKSLLKSPNSSTSTADSPEKRQKTVHFAPSLEMPGNTLSAVSAGKKAQSKVVAKSSGSTAGSTPPPTPSAATMVKEEAAYMAAVKSFISQQPNSTAPLALIGTKVKKPDAVKNKLGTLIKKYASDFAVIGQNVKVKA